MDDLISRKALIAEYDRVHIGEPGKTRKLIEEAPTVDAVEVVHGRWNVLGLNYYIVLSRCSECGAKYDFQSPYCPNCGAKMDGGKEDGC